MPCEERFLPMRIATFGSCLVALLLSCAELSADAIRIQPSTTGLLLDLLPEEALQHDTEDERSPAAPRSDRPYATQGSVAWWFEAGGGANFDHGWMALGGVGVEWYPVDGFAVGIRGDGIGVGLEGTPATAGGGASLLLRWHVLLREEWSIYVEGGCGLAYFSSPVPRGAARLNFTPEAGVGLTIALSDHTRLLGGVRWYHISNAQTAQSNPGVDMLEIYVGAAFTF